MNNNTSNLLEQVNLIQQKYDDLAEYTGENFNVFSILRLYSDELSHSVFIGNLLNAKAKHGQKDIFLKLFLEELQIDFDEYFSRLKFDQFDTSKSSATVEKHIGKVNYENGEGGRIDIFITDSINNIVIENKIRAGDQNQQLVRYYNAYNNAPIIYLTLDGKEPGGASCGDLKCGEQFICISYERHIVSWLEKCIKEMANKPIIRETLNQYLHLVKQLTNQTTNKKMEKEIMNLILGNENHLRAAKNIYQNYPTIIKEASLNQTKVLAEILKKHGVEASIERAMRAEGDGVFVPIEKTSSFLINGVQYELGINIELNNDMYFFCVAEEFKNRNDRINNHMQFLGVRKRLQSLFLPEKLNVHSWTLGKANTFTVGVNRENWFLPTTDNKHVFTEVAEKILALKEMLVVGFQDYTPLSQV